MLIYFLARWLSAVKRSFCSFLLTQVHSAVGSIPATIFFFSNFRKGLFVCDLGVVHIGR